MTPCPFCGAAEVQLIWRLERAATDDTSPRFRFVILCTGCAAQGPSHSVAAIAKHRWNERAECS